MVPRVGQRIGPYEILGRLGSGGMGLVFSAWDARLQRDVAIKLLREEYSSPDMRARFLQEARAASGLNHPHICTIFDIGEQGGDPYLVMELLKGETLRARITSGTINSDDIIRVGTEVADALAIAHTRGIIHRDIKPANIILVDKPGGKFGTKVLDFGLAKVEMGDGETRFDLTSIGSTVGTVSYMSPEQARGEPLDARSDLFSLGVVLYEMATGNVPFRGATSALVFVALLSAAPEPVREINAAIPKDLERVIFKLLEKDRTLRYQSAAELVDAMNRLPARGSSAGKSIWGAIPSRARTESSGSNPVADPPPPPRKPVAESERPSPLPPVSPPPGPPSQTSQLLRPPPVGESILRPVRRIVTSDPGMPAFQPARPRTASEPPLPPPAPPADSSRSGLASAPSTNTPVPEAAASSSLREDSSAPSSSRPAVAFTPVPRASGQKLPQPRFKRLDEEEEPLPSKVSAAPKEPGAARRSYPWLMVGVVVLVGAVAAWVFWPRRGPVVVSQATTIAFASLTDHSGATLSGVLTAGLEFDLEQSSRFDVRRTSDLASSLTALDLHGGDGEAPSIAEACQAAKEIGANDVLFGDVRTNGPSGYTVSFQVYDVASGTKNVDVSENASGREQLPDTIDRLASEIRSRLGESGDSIGKTSLPLGKAASANLDALQSYLTAQQALGSRQADSYLTALHALEQATTQDPHFTQAWISLAELYRRERAIKSAANAASQAQNSSAGTGQRTQLLAQASAAMNASGDYPAATGLLQSLLKAYPGDLEAGNLLATVLRLQGKFGDSQEAAQKVLTLDPYNVDASGAAEMAAMALDRPETARQIEGRIQRSGHSHPSLQLLLSYLTDRNTGQAAVDVSGDADQIGAMYYKAAVEDATGSLTAGLSDWRKLAALTAANPTLSSAAGDELSTAALDRALVEDCSTALGLLREAQPYPQGLAGLFNVGMTAALCGNTALAQQQLDTIKAGYSQSFAAKGFYYPDLAAAIQWKGGDAAGAFKTLLPAGAYDQISLTPYLRAQIRMKSGKQEDLLLAVAQYQNIIARKGATALVNPVMFSMAEFGMGRAFRLSGDKGNSAKAYQSFLASWPVPDNGQPLVKEARANAQ